MTPDPATILRAAAVGHAPSRAFWTILRTLLVAESRDGEPPKSPHEIAHMIETRLRITGQLRETGGLEARRDA